MHDKVVTVVLSATHLQVWIDGQSVEKQAMTEAFPVRLALSGFSDSKFELLPLEPSDAILQSIVADFAFTPKPSDDDSEDPVARYTKPSLTMALRLFESVADAGDCSFLFSSSQGPNLMTGLSQAIESLYLQPTNVAQYILELASKTIWTAISGVTEAVLYESPRASLRAMGEQLIQLARRVCVELSKKTYGGTLSPLFKALCQAAVMSSNLLHLDLFVREHQEEVSTVPPPRMIESNHPFLDNRDDYWTVEVPGVTCYTVTFDGRSALPSSADYVRFCKDDSHSTVWGKDKYFGDGLPGTGSADPLLIHASKFVVHFHSSSPDARAQVHP